MPKFAEVVMPSHGSDLHNLLELGEPVKYLAQVTILKAEHLHFICRGRLYRDIPILVSYLEDKTDVSKVTSFIKGEQCLFVFSPVCLHSAFVNKEYANAHCILSQDGITLV